MDAIRETLQTFCIQDFYEERGIEVTAKESAQVERAIKALILTEYSIYGEEQKAFMFNWTHEHEVDARLAYLYEAIFTEIVVPELAKEYHRNKLPLAYALSYVDSAKLDIKTRESMGLTNSPLEVPNPPALFRVTTGREWIRQCPDGPVFLSYVHQRVAEIDGMVDSEWEYNPIKGLNPYGDYEVHADGSLKKFFNPNLKFNNVNEFDTVPIVVFETLLLKRVGTIINGICSHTTEIKSNGRNIVFVEDIFYTLRDAELLSILRTHSHDIAKLPFNIFYEDGFDVIDGRLVNAILISEDFGGLWQPTVQLYNQKSMIIEG